MKFIRRGLSHFVNLLLELIGVKILDSINIFLSESIDLIFAETKQNIALLFKHFSIIKTDQNPIL